MRLQGTTDTTPHAPMASLVPPEAVASDIITPSTSTLLTTTRYFLAVLADSLSTVSAQHSPSGEDHHRLHSHRSLPQPARQHPISWRLRIGRTPMNRRPATTMTSTRPPMHPQCDSSRAPKRVHMQRQYHLRERPPTTTATATTTEPRPMICFCELKID